MFAFRKAGPTYLNNIPSASGGFSSCTLQSKNKEENDQAQAQREWDELLTEFNICFRDVTPIMSTTQSG